jgi:TRAP-type C4-dicarboxylate transport system permease small subunit
MARGLRTTMDALYWTCAVLAGVSLVLISAVIPYSVYTRYVLNRAASWPEPAAILLTIVLTFFGAAVCYRDSIHMRMHFFVRLMPGPAQRLSAVLAELLVAAVSIFMMVWGYGLCAATWRHLSADPARRSGHAPVRRGAADDRFGPLSARRRRAGGVRLRRRTGRWRS